jgi:hypothetical protein
VSSSAILSTLKVGAFGEATVEVGGVEVNAEVNLVTVNIPDKGPNTVTQGFGIGLKGVKVGKIPLFLKRGVSRRALWIAFFLVLPVFSAIVYFRTTRSALYQPVGSSA